MNDLQKRRNRIARDFIARDLLRQRNARIREGVYFIHERMRNGGVML